MVQTCSHFIENTTTATINNKPQRKCKKKSRKQNRLGEILPPKSFSSFGEKYLLSYYLLPTCPST